MKYRCHVEGDTVGTGYHCEGCHGHAITSFVNTWMFTDDPTEAQTRALEDERQRMIDDELYQRIDLVWQGTPFVLNRVYPEQEENER